MRTEIGMKSYMGKLYGTNSGMTPLECQGAVAQHRFNEELAKCPGPWTYTIYAGVDIDKKSPLGTVSFNGNHLGAEAEWAKQHGGDWWNYTAVCTYGPHKNG